MVAFCFLAAVTLLSVALFKFVCLYKGVCLFILSRNMLTCCLVPTLHNEGNYIISLGALCKWLAEQAEEAGADIFPGFAASEVL